MRPALRETKSDSLRVLILVVCVLGLRQQSQGSLYLEECMVASPRIYIFCLASLYLSLYFFLPSCACSSLPSTLNSSIRNCRFSLPSCSAFAIRSRCSSDFTPLALRFPRIIINMIKLQPFDCSLPLLLFYCMNYSLKSGPLSTQQTRYSEDIFNTGLTTIRKRINVLSSSSVFTPTRPYPTELTNPYTTNASGMLAKVSKLAFDGEMLQQDVRSEIYQLQKTKQYLTIVAQDISRNNNKLQSHLTSKLTILEQDLAYKIEQSRQKTKTLIFEVEQKRQNSDILRQQLNELGRKVKHMEDALGLYTAHQKLEST